MAARLSLEDVSFSYPLPGKGESAALADVSLEIHEGEVLCVGGANGSGKSTLLQVCAGLLSPDSGRLSYDGEPVRGRTALRRLRSRVGLLFQSPEDQLFADTVEADIAFGPRKGGLRGEALKEVVEKAAELAGLTLQALGDRSPFGLSEGEKRRVALAGVLALEPGVLLLDEPFIGLDHEGRGRLVAACGRFMEGGGNSIVIVTHELSSAWRLSDRFAFLSEGRLARTDDRAGLADGAGDLEDLGLELPEWGILARALASLGCPADDPSDPASLAAAFARWKEAGSGR